MALVAYDEGHIGGKPGFVDVSCIRCCLDGNDFFIFRNEFPQVVFLREVPFYIVFARSGAFSHSSDAVSRLGADKYHLRGPNVIGQTYHGTHVIGCEKAIGNDDGPRNGIV